MTASHVKQPGGNIPSRALQNVRAVPMRGPVARDDAILAQARRRAQIFPYKSWQDTRDTLNTFKKSWQELRPGTTRPAGAGDFRYVNKDAGKAKDVAFNISAVAADRQQALRHGGENFAKQKAMNSTRQCCKVRDELGRKVEDFSQLALGRPEMIWRR